jgi:hypothetical protein
MKDVSQHAFERSLFAIEKHVLLDELQENKVKVPFYEAHQRAASKITFPVDKTLTLASLVLAILEGG